MEIALVSIGKISTPWIKNGVAEFENRISRYIKFISKEIPDLKRAASLSNEKIKEMEGDLILNELSTSDLTVLLDEKGKEFTSREFADWIQKQMGSGRKRLVFVIGGPFGFSQKVYDRADFKVALSKLTFTHEMAKLFFCEQIYRSMTIIKGEPYHHD